MLVLDYVREMKTTTPRIIIPPFHTGHLGFVAGTTVSVGLLAPKPNTPAPGAVRTAPYPEVVISQFATNSEDIALLSATLHDRVGVVERLLTSLSSLGVNVELQESNSVSQFSEHQVDLVINVSAFDDSAGHPEVSPSIATSLYRHLDLQVPASDVRLVKLFEWIVITCADVLIWRDTDGGRLPQLSIRQTARRRLLGEPAKARVEWTGRTSYIDLPPEIAVKMRSQLRVSPQQSLSYLYVSDTDERNLRIFFFPALIRQGIFHVAFSHNDVPGALATILGLVAKAEFSILTSLLRKETPDRSIWEAVLSYRGKTTLEWRQDARGRTITGAELDWIANEIQENIRHKTVRGVPCDIQVGRPLYPLPKEGVSEGVAPVRIGADWTFTEDWENIRNFQEELQRCVAAVGTAHTADVRDDILGFIGLIGDREANARQRSVFVSYPTNARPHAEYLMNAMPGTIACEDYYQEGGEVIVEEVKRKIQRCDYFIGLWHHEEVPFVDGSFGVSPWMPFEYGIAKSMGKEPVLAYSSKVAERVWKRIDPATAHFSYTEVDFTSKTVPELIRHCERHFAGR